MNRKDGSGRSQAEVCERCDTTDTVFISLNCQHNFCLVCMSYIVLKSRANGGKEDIVSCPVCKETSHLDSSSVEAVRLTIEETLLPKLNSFRQTIPELSAQNLNEQHNESRMGQRERRINDKQPKLYSSSGSYNHVTPSTKYFFSKCESPADQEKQSRKEYCECHPLEQVSFVCLTCQNQVLCLKCVVSAKHRSHSIKNLQKAMDMVQEQLSIKKLELNERIEYYEMWHRRFQDRKQMVSQKWEKTKEQIVESFYQLVSKLKKREAQLLQICNEHYSSLEINLSQTVSELSQQLNLLVNFKSDLKTLNRTAYSTNETQRSDKSSVFFKLYNKLSQTLQQNLNEKLCPISSLSGETVLWLQDKEVVPVIQAIDNINLAFGQTNQGMGHSSKKIQAKITSLNSSREKKKKYAKTEEDEMFQCGLKRKTEHNIEASDKISRKGSNKKDLIPYRYVNKFLEKKTLKNEGNLLQSSLLDDFESVPKLNGTKMSSTKLLSKSIVPSETHYKKKKENKDRAERKTTNPLESLKNQKNLFETKRKKAVQ